MKFCHSIKYAFAAYYDLITVGPYANRIAKIVSSYDDSLKILTMEENDHVLQPSLAVLGCPIVKLQQSNHKFSDIEKGVGIQNLDAEKQQIQLKNGNKYKYKYLIYSGCSSDWKSPISHNTTHSSLQNTSSLYIHNDLQYNNMDQLFARRGGSIVFTIPKGFHFGCQNLFMMFLKAKMEQNRKNAPFQTDPIKITVMCQGGSLISFNKALNFLVQGHLAEAGVRVIKNAQYKIDVNKKKINLAKNNQIISFDSLFEYRPIATPTVLSNLNPFNTNQHFLNHNIYQNTYILGNTLPHLHSLRSTLQKSSIIAQNILYNIQKVKRRAVYEGQSSIKLWLNSKQCHYYETDYDGTRVRKDFGVSNQVRQGFGAWEKKWGKSRVQRWLNGIGTSNWSFGQGNVINTQRSLVPVLLC